MFKMSIKPYREETRLPLFAANSNVLAFASHASQQQVDFPLSLSYDSEKGYKLPNAQSGILARFCLWMIEDVYQGITGKPDVGKHGALRCAFKDKRYDNGPSQSEYSCSQYCAEAIRKYGAIPGLTRFIFHRNLFCWPVGQKILAFFPKLKADALNP